VKDKKGMMVDSLIITDFVKSLNEIKNTQKFAQQSLAQVESGDYELICQFTDLVRKKSITIRDSLKIRAFPEEKLTMSDIEFASSIARQSPAENNFDKNGLRVIPNATKIYGSGFDELHYYAEVYNLAYENGQENSTFHANYFVIDNNGKVVKEVTGCPLKKPGPSAVINGKFDLDVLASGFYQFKIEITDDATGKKTSSTKSFYIYRPGDFVSTSKPVIDKSVGLLQEFLAMDGDSLNKYFEQLKYLALKEEKDIFKKLDDNGKRNFLVEFWRQRDPAPETPVNEKKEEYFRLLRYANRNFSVGKKPGWKTDRARILLIYGKPDEVERFPSSTEFKAYQIWHYYNLLGGVKFYFVDIRRVGDYQLVHSTHPDEVQQADWRDMYARLR
jgi:GWxTD domain-containing protein